jgi:hypothetical protein
MECWSDGVEYWSNGVVEQWSLAVPPSLVASFQYSNTPLLHHSAFVRLLSTDYFSGADLQILLIRTKGIPVMLTNYGFYSIRVACFDRGEDLAVLFLGLREAVSENLF